MLGGIQQLALLFICITYSIRDWRRKKILLQETIEEDNEKKALLYRNSINK